MKWSSQQNDTQSFGKVYHGRKGRAFVNFANKSFTDKAGLRKMVSVHQPGDGLTRILGGGRLQTRGRAGVTVIMISTIRVNYCMGSVSYC